MGSSENQLRQDRKGAVSFLVMALAVGLVLVGVLVYVFSGRGGETPRGAEESGSVSNQSEPGGQAVKAKVEDVAIEQAHGYEGELISGNSSRLYAFVRGDFEVASKSDKLIVLYFYNNASALSKSEAEGALYPAFDELQTANAIGFRVNFNDKETDNLERALARAYGVTVENTKVFVIGGKRVLRSSDNWGKDKYLTEIQNRAK